MALCPAVALLGRADAATAFANADQVIAAERRLGVFAEPAFHQLVAGNETLLAIMSAVYLSAHGPVTIGALIWVALRRPQAWPLLRRSFLATQVLIVCGYLLFPCAPPRLLPSSAFSDTTADVWGEGMAAASELLQSPYAAVPSGHVAFALIAGGSIALLARQPLVRILGVLWPVVTVLIVVATANHFFFDAFAAALVTALGFALAYVSMPCRFGHLEMSGAR